MLAFVDFPGLDRSTRYQLVSQTATEVVYRATLAGHFEVTRRYVLSPDQSDANDPYRVRAETSFRNLTDQTIPPMRVDLSPRHRRALDLLDLGPVPGHRLFGRQGSDLHAPRPAWRRIRRDFWPQSP